MVLDTSDPQQKCKLSSVDARGALRRTIAVSRERREGNEEQVEG